MKAIMSSLMMVKSSGVGDIAVPATKTFYAVCQGTCQRQGSAAGKVISRTLFEVERFPAPALASFLRSI
jgi:hypothetical protein